MRNLATKAFYWRYENQELENLNLVSDITQSICTECGFNYPNSKLETVLSEIITNAIDHGVLGLDSKVKDRPNGFSKYLSERNKRMAALDGSWVSITVESIDSQTIQMAVQDSGPGFDKDSVYPFIRSPIDLSLFGRGLLIVQSLCKSMAHVGNGNCIVVEFKTSAEDQSQASNRIPVLAD